MKEKQRRREKKTLSNRVRSVLFLGRPSLFGRALKNICVLERKKRRPQCFSMPSKRRAGLLSRRAAGGGAERGKRGDAIDDDDVAPSSDLAFDSGRSSSPHPLDAAVASRHNSNAPPEEKTEKEKKAVAAPSRDDKEKTKSKWRRLGGDKEEEEEEQEEREEEAIMVGSSSSSSSDEEERQAKKKKKKTGEAAAAPEAKAEAIETEAPLVSPPLPQPTGVVVVPDGAPRAGSDAVRRLLRPVRYFTSSGANCAAAYAATAAGAGTAGGEKAATGNGSGKALLEAALEAADAGGRSCWRCGGGGHIARECPLGPAPKPCHLCGQLGHARYECPNGKERKKKVWRSLF